MKVRIEDSIKFQRDNAAYFSSEYCLQNDMEVLAIFGKKQKEVLLKIGEYDLDFYKFKEEYMTIIDSDIPDTWTYVKRYRYNGKDNHDSPELVILRLNDLYAPDWMVSSDFLYSVIMNKDKAFRLLRAKTKNNA
jgi:hypothetical protein